MNAMCSNNKKPRSNQSDRSWFLLLLYKAKAPMLKSLNYTIIGSSLLRLGKNVFVRGLFEIGMLFNGYFNISGVGVYFTSATSNGIRNVYATRIGFNNKYLFGK